MNYPIALEAYAQIEESDELDPALRLHRQVVYNEIEAQAFLREFPKSRIVTKNLTAEELQDPRIN